MRSVKRESSSEVNFQKNMSSNSPTRGKHEDNDGTYDSSADDEDALFDEVVCGVAFGESKTDDKKNPNPASAKALPAQSRADVEPKVEWKTEIEKELPAKMEQQEQEEWEMTENPQDTAQTVNWDEEEYDIKDEEETSSYTCRTTEEKHESARKRMREESLEKRYERVSRNRRNSGSSSSTTSSGISAKRPDFESDPAVLARRQKDIEYGKNTIGYDRYIKMIPKDQRTREHPRTPPKYVKYSRRGWDGMVKLWRKQLHQWDPPEENGDKKDVANPSSA